MNFTLPVELEELSALLLEFIDLVGETRWWTRADQLRKDALRSPAHAVIVANSHWLEMELSEQLNSLRSAGRCTDIVSSYTLSALYFAGMVVEVHRRLAPQGQVQLFGRLRDSLKTGFAGLYLEMEMARVLLDGGFAIDFPDLEHRSSYDLYFRSDDIEGEIECKSISADAGRKIHRRDFTRLIESLEVMTSSRVHEGVHEILLISLDDRLPSDVQSHQLLKSVVCEALANGGAGKIRGPFFSVEQQNYEQIFSTEKLADNSGDLYSLFRKEFGQACHVAGAMTETGCCLIVMKSGREDDHSAPELDALKKAASQLSGSRPSFIAVQYEDIDPEDLTKPSLRRRAGILDTAVFLSGVAGHVNGIYHSSYPGVHLSKRGPGTPAFMVMNKHPRFPSVHLPFRDTWTNSEFARVLNVDPSRTDGETPTLTVYKTDSSLVDSVFEQATSMARDIDGGGSQVAVLCLNEALFDKIRVAGRSRDKFVPITTREDLKELRYAKNKCVFSMPEFVAGLQFHTVFLIHADSADYDEDQGQGTRRRYVSSVYLGASRAASNILLASSKEHGGPSRLLDAPLANNTLWRVS